MYKNCEESSTTTDYNFQKLVSCHKAFKGKKLKEGNIQCKNYERINWNLQILDDMKLMHLMHLNNSVADQLSNDAIKLDKGIIV